MPSEGGGLRLQSFASEPAISRVNPALGHSACHRYTAADPSRLAEAVVAACAADGGVRAEVLVRSFYPVVTDTVVARVSGVGPRGETGVTGQSIEMLSFVLNGVNVT